MRALFLSAAIGVGLMSTGMVDACHGQSTYEAVDQVLPRVVKIFGAGGLRNLESYGTGFLVSPKGHIVTVWSHVLDSDRAVAVLNDGRRYRVKLIGAEPRLDAAVIQLDHEGEEFPYFDLTQAIEARAGTRVLAFSNMFKVATGDEPVSVQQGVIAATTSLSARRGTFKVPYSGPVYIVDAITNNVGSGGGVLTTRQGYLLGMIGKQLRNSEQNIWINYVVPIPQIRDAVDDLIQGRRPTSDPLASSDTDREQRYTPLDWGLVMIPNIVARTPAYVDAVIANSPAAESGFQPDDLIVLVNDEIVRSADELNRQMAKLMEGDLLRIVVRRQNELISFEMPVPSARR